MGIWPLLIQFVFRLSFGVAWAMAATPHRWVSDGFYRVHLWVLMGLNTFALLAIATRRTELAELPASPGWLLAAVALLVIGSYAGSVLWLYGLRSWGRAFLCGIGVVALVAAIAATPWDRAANLSARLLGMAELAASGLLLGMTLAAMLLGHWYLNTPTMELLPLRRLVMLMAAAILARALVAASGLALESSASPPREQAFWILLGFRWLAGLIGTSVLALMTWWTLRVPNTQSATGILYASVILSLLGELTAQLLSVDAQYPL